MKLKYLSQITSVLLILITIYACNNNEYNNLVESELKKNITYDSLFLGISLDMGKKDFYTHCWEMNKKGFIRQGPNNLSVQYAIDSGELRHSGFMHFYPEFEENKISMMPMQFTYEAFTPTDSTYYSSSLLLDVKNMLERWYGGNDFIYLENEQGNKSLWVKVDGNRRIRIFKKGIRIVAADIMDLRKIKSDEK